MSKKIEKSSFSFRLALGLAFLPGAAALGSDLPEYTLTIKNARFEPSVIEIPTGQKVKLLVKNEGPGAEEFESSDLNREKVVAPGKSIVVFVGPLKPGSYGFFGDFHKDTAQGKIIVK